MDLGLIATSIQTSGRDSYDDEEAFRPERRVVEIEGSAIAVDVQNARICSRRRVWLDCETGVLRSSRRQLLKMVTDAIEIIEQTFSDEMLTRLRGLGQKRRRGAFESMI